MLGHGQVEETQSCPEALESFPLAPSEEGVELYCPFVSGLNPHVDFVQRASLDWCVRMQIVAPGKALERLTKSKVGWLEARAFLNASEHALQIASDWTHLFCLLDDRTDKLECPVGLGAFLNGLLEVFRTGVLFPDLAREPFAHAFMDLRARMLEASTPRWVAGFADHLRSIFVGYGWETINVEMGIRPDLGTYLNMRRITIGLYPQFHLATLTDGVDLPAEVYGHPVIQRLMAATSNLVGWANDLCTYEKEIEDGERHNLVVVLMDQESLSIEQAAARAVEMHDAEVGAFLEVAERVPSFGEWDEQVVRFVDVLRAWIRGHLDWAQETGRYRPQQFDARGKRASQSSGTWARASEIRMAG